MAMQKRVTRVKWLKEWETGWKKGKHNYRLEKGAARRKGNIELWRCLNPLNQL